jgi:hypothetical protein
MLIMCLFLLHGDTTENESSSGPGVLNDGSLFLCPLPDFRSHVGLPPFLWFKLSYRLQLKLFDFLVLHLRIAPHRHGIAQLVASGLGLVRPRARANERPIPSVARPMAA